MKLFNLDCHISVIADLKQILENLGHEVESWSVSGHNWVFDREPTKVDIVNPNTWMNLDESMCDQFYERYKHELSTYDAFICTYPPAFSMLYKRFQKPIILQIPIRYEVPFHNNVEKWNNFNQYLRDGIDSGFIFPVANSEYDKKYFEFFVNRECQLIPNICEYTNTTYKPEFEKFLYYSRLPVTFNGDFIIDKSSLGRYKFSDITKFKGIIMIPYNCSTMSIFEYYTSNIPLFVPSKSFMIELYSNFSNYVLSELTWNKTFNLSPSSVIDCDRENDPNSYNNIDIMRRWIEFSDFYNEDWMPFITYFDSLEELQYKLINTDLKDISSKMKSFNVERKSKIYSLWQEKIKVIDEKSRNR
jgi:hypothetical protein